MKLRARYLLSVYKMNELLKPTAQNRLIGAKISGGINLER